MQVVVSCHHMARTTRATASRVGVVRRPDGLVYLSPERARAFLGLVRAGDALARELNAELEQDHGLSLRAFEVLLFLAVFAPAGHLRMAELTEQTPLSQSRVSRLVAELEARGLVERSAADGDRRGVAVSITRTGLATFKDAQDSHLASLERRLFAHLSAREIGQLAALTSRILDAQTKEGDGRTAS